MQIKRVKVQNPKNIVVFGKGKSLSYFKIFFKANRVDIDLIILCNFKDNDLENLKILPKIKNIPILIIGNITEPLISKNSLKKINIFRFYINRLYSQKKRSSKIYGKRTNHRFNSVSKKTFYLPKYTEKIFKILKKKKISYHLNCGLSGITIATSFKPDKIFLFGFDFYETNYFDNSKINSNEIKLLDKLQLNFINFFYALVKDNLKIKFYCFTKAKIKFDKVVNLYLRSV